MKNKFLLTIIIAVSVIFIFSAFFAGVSFQKQKETKTFMAKFGDIETEVEYSQSDEVFNTIGHVIQKDENSIIINTQSESGFFQGESSKDEITEIKINTDEQTKIMKIISFPNGDRDYESINFSDIQEGDFVQIFSNEDIKGKSEFTASKINLFD